MRRTVDAGVQRGSFQAPPEPCPARGEPTSGRSGRLRVGAAASAVQPRWGKRPLSDGKPAGGVLRGDGGGGTAQLRAGGGALRERMVAEMRAELRKRLRAERSWRRRAGAGMRLWRRRCWLLGQRRCAGSGPGGRLDPDGICGSAERADDAARCATYRMRTVRAEPSIPESGDSFALCGSGRR